MRLLKQLVVSILLLFAFSFTYTEVSANPQTSVVDVEVVSYFDENNTISTTIQSQVFGAKISFATSLSTMENYSFVFWNVNGIVRTDLSVDNLFPVKDGLSIKGVFKPSGKVVAVFQDSNGKVIDIQYLNPGQAPTAIADVDLPTKPGYVYATPRWDKPLSALSTDAVYTLQYTVNTSSNYSVSITNGSGDGTYAYNQIATAVADTPAEGMHFDYWKSGDRIVSRNATHSFTVLGPVSIEAVYSDTAPKTEPWIAVSNDLALRSGYESYIGQFGLPEGYDLIEYGIISSNASESIVLGQVGVTKHQANRYLAETNEFLISVQNTAILSARAYMIVEDTDGNFVTVYSQNVASTPNPVYATDLFFSAYLEGSSNNKALAIFNGTGSTVDLSSYSIKLFNNGAVTANQTLTLSGSLAHNAVYVIVNGSATASILSLANLVNSNITGFNGDDALTLLKNGVVIDSFGQVGFDPGTAWSVNGVTTLDKTLIRKSSTLSGDADSTNAFDPSVEWTQQVIDSITNLDTFTMDSGSTPLVVVALDAFVLKTAYFVNDALDVANSYLRVFYDDGSSGIVDLNGSMVSDFTTTSAGTRLMTITYSGKTDLTRYVVAKATPSYSVPSLSNQNWTSGMTLASIALPSGFSWDAPSSTPSIGSNTFTVTYTPTDTNAYLVVSGISVTFTVVMPTTPIVIYEIYGGGGNTGAIYTNDYVVLKNNTAVSVDLSTYSLQYGSATGSTYSVLNLTGTLYANSYYLIQLSSSGAVGSALPITPSASGSLALAATAGKIALVSNQTVILNKDDTDIVDFVGYGSANESETLPTSAPSNTTSVKRGSSDTNDNAADFTVVTPDLSYLTTNVVLVGFGVRNLTTTYDLNASLNVQNAEILAYYSNGTSQTVALLAGHVSNFSTASLGTFQMTITYGGISNQVSYSVMDLSNISLVEVHFIDIGATGGGPGESTLIQIGATDILIDSGEGDTNTRNALLAFLAGNVTDGTIEYIVATHPDADHIGNFIAVMDAYLVSTVIRYSTDPSASTTLRTDFEARIVTEGSSVLYAYALATGGDNTLDIATSIWLEFYDSGDLQSTTTNYSSIVMTLDAFGTRMLFAGDGDGNEADYVSLVGDVDIWKMSHHASASGTASASLSALTPEVLIVSNGDYLGNQFGHPTYAALNRVYTYSNNLPVYAVTGGNGSGSDRSLERNGTITVTITSTNYAISSQHYGVNPLELSNTAYWNSLSNPYRSIGYYYASATGITSGSALKLALYDIIKGHTKVTYTQATESLKTTDQDPNNANNVIFLYTGRSQDKETFVGSTNNQDYWNREHVWAKSHGFPTESLDAYSDLHHLRVSDVSVNSARGNLDFGNVAHTVGNIVSDTYASGSTYSYSDGTYFEPRDEVKGDVARMMFYMAVRYQGASELNLSLVNGTTTDGVPQFGNLAALLAWNLSDRVDSLERFRHERIYQIQANRNPFVDRPEWASIIWTS
jgi:endonuclease I